MQYCQFFSNAKNTDNSLTTVVQSLAFGGGGHGMNQTAFKKLSEIWTFEYMGAAEYEFGALPKAFEFLMNSEIEVLDFMFPVNRIPEVGRWDKVRRKDGKIRKKQPPGRQEDLRYFVICPTNHKEEVSGEALKVLTGEARIKGGNRFLMSKYFRPNVDYLNEVTGWVDVGATPYIFTIEQGHLQVLLKSTES